MEVLHQIPHTEEEEKAFLWAVLRAIEGTMHQIDADVQTRARELEEQKRYLHENKAGMDHVEKISVRQSIDQSSLIGETMVAKKNRYYRLQKHPYFGRIDWTEEGKLDKQAIYIGIHSFFYPPSKKNLIFDWRAPISSIFYDYEPGPAAYEPPEGEQKGTLHGKRQYRVNRGRLEFMLESDLHIHDDVLQAELSRSADDKMKQIVATIQREQNAIIRDTETRELIIQGVAGSGKTSIALHRVAFLLYRHRDSLTAEDLLIISPNKVFSDYISNVLPELGEENLPERQMSEIAEELLGAKYTAESYEEQVHRLIHDSDTQYEERIQFKAQYEFVRQMEQYLLHIENNYFSAEGFVLKKNYIVPDWYVAERFQHYSRIPILPRLRQVATDIEQNILLYYNYRISASERNDIRKKVKSMLQWSTLRQFYKDFYDWIGRPKYLKQADKSRYEYADIFPLIFLKIKLEGTASYRSVDHILIDEMQDYTPIQYAVLDRVFSCPKTLLGDAAQSLNPLSSSNACDIQKVFPAAKIVRLTTSYRSTAEITNFSRQWAPDVEIKAIDRHGPPPAILAFEKEEDEIEGMVDLIARYEASENKSLAIICAQPEQAARLNEKLAERLPQLYYLSEDSAQFQQGLILTSTRVAKGLEFDEVILSHLNLQTYYREIDRSLLYIGATRAMHRLTLTYSGQPSPLLPSQD